MIDQNWTRWIFASMSKFFDSKRGSYPLYIEGEERDLETSPRAEFRLNGPYYSETTKDNWRIEANISILISSTVSNNIHDHPRAIGLFQSAFEETIDIFRLGDDGTLLGCMLLVNYGDETILTNNFGQIDSNTRLLQSEINGTYRMRIP